MNPKYITIHCSATKPKHDCGVDWLSDLHINQNGWSDIGYHAYITTDGKINFCRPLTRTGAHVKGHNDDNIGICLEGGLNNDTGKPDNTFSSHQMLALKGLVKSLQDAYWINNSNVKGHRDWGANKACPCFDVRKWIKEW